MAVATLAAVERTNYLNRSYGLRRHTYAALPGAASSSRVRCQV